MGNNTTTTINNNNPVDHERLTKVFGEDWKLSKEELAKKVPMEMLNSDFMESLKQNEKMALFNLACTRRDLRCYLSGSKPHRHWKITGVKQHFNLTGSGQKLFDQFMLLYKAITPYEFWPCPKHGTPTGLTKGKFCRECLKEQREAAQKNQGD